MSGEELRELCLPDGVAPAPEPAERAPEWGRYAMVPVAALAIDPAYQRPVNRRGVALIKRIVSDFDAGAFAALLGRWEGGRFAVVDGQHRALAAKALGLQVVPCLEIGSDAPRLFERVNRRRVQLTPLALFHAECAAGEAEALAIRRAVGVAELCVPRQPPTPGARQPDHVTAVGTMRRVLRRHGEGALGAGLSVLAEASRKSGADWLMGPPLAAGLELAGRLVADGAPGLSEALDALEAALVELCPEELSDRARARVRVSGGAQWHHLATMIADAAALPGGEAAA